MVVNHQKHSGVHLNELQGYTGKIVVQSPAQNNFRWDFISGSYKASCNINYGL